MKICSLEEGGFYSTINFICSIIEIEFTNYERSFNRFVNDLG